ncbi:hypothetical protein ACP70R_018480 [Stipagrostis hirtigluma subsp. patula]
MLPMLAPLRPLPHRSDRPPPLSCSPQLPLPSHLPSAQQDPARPCTRSGEAVHLALEVAAEHQDGGLPHQLHQRPRVPRHKR